MGTASKSDEDTGSLPSFAAAFPWFRTFQTRGSGAVFVNKEPAFLNSKSGLRLATNEPISRSVRLSYTIRLTTSNTKSTNITNKTDEKLQSLVGARNTAAVLGAILFPLIVQHSYTLSWVQWG